VTASRRRLALIGVLIVAAAALPIAFASRPEASGRLPLVYISGLDDHLLPAYPTVPLHDSPGGAVIAAAPADTLAWVHAERGEWLDVSLVSPAAGRGWVADYYLRGELHVVSPDAPGCAVAMRHSPGEEPHGHVIEPSTRVRLLDLAPDGDTTWVLVRILSTGGEVWVDRTALSERPGPDIRRAETGTDCADILPEPVVPHEH
jgi:hypothetical protein